jgi:eukaryotic-like serine/threonine-protein kinase
MRADGRPIVPAGGKMKWTGPLIALIVSPVALGDAPMFRATAQHAAIYQSVGAGPVGKVKWTFATGAAVTSSAAVVDGTVYIGSDDHYLYALVESSGKLRWKFKTGDRVSSSPAVSGGMVFFGSYDGNLYAIDAASGAAKWKFATAGERRFEAKHLHGANPASQTVPDPFDVYLSSPTVESGRVYFGSGDGNVYALDASSGKKLWQFRTADVVHASPAVSDGIVYIGSWDANFYALDAASGKERWRFRTGKDPAIHNQVGIQSSATVADDVVYFGCRDSKLYALDARSGQQRWQFSNAGSWVISSPVVRAGVVYFATSDTGLFYALNAASGAEVFQLKFNQWPMFSSPAIAGEMLYLGSNRGTLIAIDLSSQTVAWTFATEGSRRYGARYTKKDGSPNYQAAFASDFYDDLIVGVSKMLALGAVLGSPVIVNDVVYFGATDGRVYALQ